MKARRAWTARPDSKHRGGTRQTQWSLTQCRRRAPWVQQDTRGWDGTGGASSSATQTWLQGRAGHPLDSHHCSRSDSERLLHNATRPLGNVSAASDHGVCMSRASARIESGVTRKKSRDGVLIRISSPEHCEGHLVCSQAIGQSSEQL